MGTYIGFFVLILVAALAAIWLVPPTGKFAITAT